MKTYMIGCGNLSDGLTGIVLTGFREGCVVTRMNLAVVANRAALIDVVTSVCIRMAAEGVEAV